MKVGGAVHDEIEDILVMCPMQEGMLFHSLAAAEAGMYIQQLVVRVVGDLKIANLERAWAEVVARHQALRSAFVWESAEQPLQVVFRKVPSSSRHEDWRVEPEAVRAERLQKLVETDRHAPFILRQPPLFRLTCVRMRDDEYRLIFTYHHLVLDGWSGSTVFKEMLIFYDALCRGSDADLPPAIGLRRYTEWARDQKLEEAESFFRKYLAGFSAPTPLYQDRRTESCKPAGSAFGSREALLSSALTATLRDFARSHRITLSTLLQGAWAAMLSRHSGERDVLFGAVSSGRPAELAGVEQMVGMFINTLPARIRIELDDRLVPWLQQLQRDMTTLRQYEHVPLVKIHQWSELPTGSALFETCQVWENAGIDLSRPFSAAGLEMSIEQHFNSVSDPITMLAFPGSQLKVRLVFDCGRVACHTAERLLAHLETWLEGVPQLANARIVEFPLLTNSEQRQLRVDWMGPERDVPPACVHHLFAARVEQTPNALAVQDGESSYTYRELDERANQIAHALRAMGVSRTMRVGISLRRSADIVASVLGVMKANATYVPLDPAFPAARLEFIAQDTQLSALLAHTGCLERLPIPESQVLFLDRDCDRIAAEPISPPFDQSAPEDVVYVLHTSGSTGQPKGVQVQHASFVNFLLGMQELPAVRGSDILLAVTSLSFDIAGLEIFGPLLAGARVVIAPQAAVADGVELCGWLARSGATVMQATPATWRMLLAADWRPDPSFRVLVGGEALGADLARRLSASGATVWNLYGPTETTVWSTAWQLQPNRSQVSIGRPILNTRVYVLDPAGQPVPVGVGGELFIGGLGVALGYLNRPDLTSERFVHLPVAGSERLYRTGDLVRWHEDGTLEFIGRSDAQIKLRGHRIELGEIEAVLNEEPTVAQSAVTVVDDVAGEQAIIGYVVPHSAHALGEVGTALTGEHSSDWRRAWDDAYAAQNSPKQQGASEAAGFNTKGWNSSYDGNPIAADQMREWLDATVTRVRSLEPRRILEVGCGTGMLLFSLAADCEAYVGADFSREGLANIAGNLGTLGQAASRVALVESEASELGGIEDGAFDTVIVNSVVQYFPSVHATVEVLSRAIQKLEPLGQVIVGDVRDLTLHAAFWTSVHLYRAEPKMTLRALREQVERSLANEKELLLHPAFFAALPTRLPRVSGARIWLKRGHSRNEMVRFRYDVVLELDREQNSGGGLPTRAVDWGIHLMRVTELKDVIADVDSSGLLVRGIPNHRTLQSVLASRLILQECYEGTVEALEREIKARCALAVDPEDIWAAAENNDLIAELMPSLTAGPEYFDAVLRPRRERQSRFTSSLRRAATTTRESPEGRVPVPYASGEQASASAGTARGWEEYANDPLQARLSRVLAPALRDALGNKLPSYMIPSRFVFLETLPLTPNGKVDRRALPHPGRAAEVRSKAYVAPRDVVELQLARAWEEVLGISPVGVHDDFFDLGGHSILSMRLFAQLEKRFGKRLPLSILAVARTVEALAHLIRSAQQSTASEILVTIQAAGKKPPLFCIHPAGGDVLCYLGLSRALGPDYPVFALQSALDQQGHLVHRTVSEMAAAYVETMRRAKPHGPYRLAGWSLGGLVAAEMAEILRASGETTSFVGLFDTVIRSPGSARALETDASRRVTMFVRYIETHFQRSLNIPGEELATREGESLLSYLVDRMRSAEVMPPDVDLEYARRLFRIYGEHTEAYHAHEPSRFTTRMTLMRARTPLAAEFVHPSMPTNSRTLGWSEYCDEPVRVIDVPGDHLTILSAGPVQELAERLRAALDESELQSNLSDVPRSSPVGLIRSVANGSVVSNVPVAAGGT